MLPWQDLRTLLTPPSRYYARRIAEEIRSGEPELALLKELMPNGGTAVDVGANQGFFSYALAAVADRVIAFEANPDYAFFSRVMLRGKAEVCCLAIAKATGRATFHVPINEKGEAMHFAGSLDDVHTRLFPKVRTYEVELRALDSFALTNVRFLKVDVEGTERDVLDGARATIMRDRPVMVLELLSGTHADPLAITKGICADFGYEALLVTRDGKVPALPAIAELGKNTTWGTDIETRNVLFVAR